MLNFFHALSFSKKALSQTTTQAITAENLEQFIQQLRQICDSVQERNLTLVSNAVESTSGHNNHNLVKVAVYFVKECELGFNSNHANDYAKSDYFNVL